MIESVFEPDFEPDKEIPDETSFVESAGVYADNGKALLGGLCQNDVGVAFQELEPIQK
jgi:hypothetical protein